jgi:hypothetical protein
MFPISADVPVQTMIVRYASLYGVDPQKSLAVAECESSMGRNLVNPTSSARGIYMFTIGTWNYIGSPGDRLDAGDSVRAFMEWYKKYPNWWVCK